jgi:hypothetical protein
MENRIDKNFLVVVNIELRRAPNLTTTENIQSTPAIVVSP